MKKVLSLTLALLMAVSCFAGVGMQAFAGQPKGWDVEEVYEYVPEEDAYRYTEIYRYYVDGNPVKGWKYIDGHWYFFDLDGINLRDQLYWDADDEVYYLDGNGWRATGWQLITNHPLYEDENLWYYFKKDGKAVKGWNQIGKKWYYFKVDKYEPDPYMLWGAIYYIDGKYYYLDDNGAMFTGWKKQDGEWYYFTGDGAAIGWKKIGRSWYYFANDGVMINDSLVQIKGVYYSFYKSGALFTGWWKIDKDWFYFTVNGVARGWTKIGGAWYYFEPLSGGDVRGMTTGWKKISGKWYYFNSSGAMLASTSKKIGGKTYKFNASGVCTNP